MKRLLLPLIFLSFGSWVYAQHTQQTQTILKKNRISKFVTCPLDLMLDTLAAAYKLNIVFERDSLHKMDIVDHYFDETLKDVIAHVCSKNNLHYWIEADGALYILQNTDDLDRLRQFNKLKQTGVGANIQAVQLPSPKSPPTNFGFSISGKVINGETGEALPSATVHIINTTLSASSRNDGNFLLFNVPSDTCVIEAIYSGFQPDRIRLDAKKIKSDVVLALLPALNTLNEVTVTGKKSGVMNTDVKKVGVLQLSPANLDKLPSIGEKDMLRAFQLMPGVGATNESSSGAYVRGGTPDQNLVVFDGFTIYQVDHLYGFFSAFNSNAVKDVLLYKGGFSSRYGGRLSSVTEINGKDGNKNESSFGVDLSLLSLNAFAELPVNDNSTLVLAIRRSYQGPMYDEIFNQFNKSAVSTGGGFNGRPGGGGFGPEQTTPASHFYDADIRYTYHLDKTNVLTWSFYNGDDKTDNSRALEIPSFLSSSTGNINITDYTKYGNTGSSLKWFHKYNKKVYSNAYLTYSSYFNDRDRTTSGTNTDSNGNAQSFNNGTLEQNNLKDVGVKSEWAWEMSEKFKLEFGGFATRQQTKYNYTQNDTAKLIDQNNSALVAGGYAELSYDPTNKLHLQPGLRATYYGPTGKVYLEPRFSGSYTLTDHYTLKVATGQFDQFINQVTREDILNGNRNFWVLSNNSSIPVGSARHYMGGISYETDLFLVDIEGYYKTLSGLTQYTVRQTGFGPGGFGGVNTTLTQDFYNGTGRAKGVEILVQKKLGRYTGWLSYTLGKAENKYPVFGDKYYPADQDVTHEFKVINMYHYYRWNFSAVWLFSTGHPYTAPLSSYTISTLDGGTTTAFNVGAKNGQRLPDYHRLDISATYDLLKISGNKIGSIGLSLFNVYNHTNIWYKEYQLQNYQAITTDVSYLGFTPNITLSLRWK